MRRRSTASRRPRRAAPCRDLPTPNRAAASPRAACPSRAGRHPRSMRNREAQASDSRSSASSSNSNNSSSSSNSNANSVTIGEESPRVEASREAADGLPGHRARPNAAAVTSDGRVRDRQNRARIIARGPRVPPAITDPAESVVHNRHATATASVRDRARAAAIDAPDRHPSIRSGLRDRILAGGNPARVPERGGGAADRVASHHGEQNAGDRAQGRAAVREIADGQGPMFPEGANDGAAGLGREIEVESHDPSRAIAMVRSRHIDTGIEVRTCS
jgi:hypothetical protein